jgi:putative DNA primase/helicase
MIKLSTADPEIPMELYGRAADNWRPLLAIADAAGDEWPERARQIAIKFGGRRDEQTAGVMLLEDVKRIFDEERVDRIPSQDLVAKLVKREERPWVEWNNHKPITPKQLADLLDAFQIVPNTIRIGASTPKGYRVEQFRDAFARYTRNFPATPPQPSKTAGFSANSSATRPDDAADKNSQKTSNFAACGGVADNKAADGQDAQVRCAQCGEPDTPGDAVRPFGLDPPTQLHLSCWQKRHNLKVNGYADNDDAGGPA